MESKSSDDTLRAQDLETSLDISNLLYLEKKESNVIVERSQKIQYSDSPVNYDDSVVVLNFQTGSDYISSKDSYLRVVLKTYASDRKTATTGVVTLGKFGTILNCFKTVRVVGRAGDVVAQIDSSNLLNYYKINYEHTRQWKEQQGSALIGWSGTGNGTVIPNGASTEFLIPLQLVCPFFESPELLPNMLCRGMRLEITLENPSVAFQQKTATDLGSYSLEGVQLHLDSYTLTSGALNWLNDRSASNGLVMTYQDYENSHFSKGATTTSYAYEVRKTASMANAVMTIFRESRVKADGGAGGTPATTELDQNSFGSSQPVATDTMQYRVASLYLPIQPIVGPLQIYQQQNYALDRLRTGQELGVSLAEFNEERGLAVHPAILDRYWLEGSGLAINNSTTLVVQGVNAVSIGGAQAEPKDVDMFLKHTRSLTIFLQNLRRSD